MVLGHYGIALAAKRIAPRTCLGWLLAAAAGVDLIWPVFLLLGIEHVRISPGLMAASPLDFYDYPITHSLVGGIGWGVVFGAVYFAINRDRVGALVVGALVVSHWFLDAIAHRPDLPIYPGSPTIGLGLWRSIPGTLVAEAVFFAAGIWIYTRTATPKGLQGRIALWSFVIFAAALYLAGQFGPPPPDERTLAWAALGQWIIVPWGWWIDARREVTRGSGVERVERV